MYVPCFSFGLELVELRGRKCNIGKALSPYQLPKSSVIRNQWRCGNKMGVFLLTSFEILRHAKLPSVMTSRLRWLEHLTRIDGSCIPRQVLYGELMREVGLLDRPKPGCKDICKSSVQNFPISRET